MRSGPSATSQKESLLHPADEVAGSSARARWAGPLIGMMDAACRAPRAGCLVAVYQPGTSLRRTPPKLRRVLGSCNSVCPRASCLDLGKHLPFTLLIPGSGPQPTFQG